MRQQTPLKDPTPLWKHVFHGVVMVFIAPVVLVLIALGLDTFLPGVLGDLTFVEAIPTVLFLITGVALVIGVPGYIIIGLGAAIYQAIKYRRPKNCMNCGKAAKLHGYHRNKLGTPNDYFFICSDCLLDQLKTDLHQADTEVVFVEPLLEEGYAYTPFSKERDEGINLKTYLPIEKQICQDCKLPAKTVWLPSKVQNDRAGRYRLEFLPKDRFKGEVTYYCYDHVVERFNKDRKKKIFWEIWSILEPQAGYFW